MLDEHAKPWSFGRGVSCPAVTECILVGFDKNSAGTQVTFAGQTP